MEITESVRKIFQEMIVPELVKIREENHKIVAILELTNKRLDDVNTHLADQSRRIDDTNKRIDEVRSELTERMEKIHSDMVRRMDSNNERIDRFFSLRPPKRRSREWIGV